MSHFTQVILFTDTDGRARREAHAFGSAHGRDVAHREHDAARLRERNARRERRRERGEPCEREPEAGRGAACVHRDPVT